MENSGGLLNASCYSNTGEKRIALRQGLNGYSVNPVITRIFSGYRSTRSTIQLCEKDDIIIQHSWDRSGSSFEWDPGVQKWLRENEPAVYQWFVTTEGRGESYLPFEGPTLAEIAKEKRYEKISKLLGKYAPSFAAFMVSPKDEVSLTPVSDPSVLNLVPHRLDWSGSVVGISEEVLVFGSYDLKSGFLLEIQPDMESGSNYAHSEHYKEELGNTVGGYLKGLEIVQPKFLVVLKKGAFTKDHYSYGCSIKVVLNPLAMSSVAA